MADVDETTEGIQVVEGSSVPLSLDILDDVQVRNVELLVNGEVVTNDVSAPFDFFAAMPTLAAGATTATVQVRATDTGGNSTLSNELTFELVPDTIAPVVVSTTPDIGGAGFDVSSISIRFNEALDTSLVSLAGITLTNLGADGTIGGGDDVVSPLRLVQTPSERRLAIFTQNPLEFGNYQLSLDSSIISDKAGNNIASPFSFQFTSYDLPSDTVVWISDSDGDWNDASNWNTGFVPSIGDKVVIDRIASNPVVSLQQNTNIESLVSNEPFSILSSNLTVTGSTRVNSDFSIDAGGLVVDGPEASFIATEATAIDGAALFARNGAQLSLPNLASYAGNSANFFTTLRAEGAGSLLDLSNVTTLSGATFVNDVLKIEAADGGRVDLSQLEEVTGGLTGFTADGEASIIDLQALTSFTRTGRGGSSLNVLNGGTINAGQLVALDGVGLSLGENGTLPTSQIETITNGAGVIVDGVSPDFSSLTDITGAGFLVRNGGTLALPVTSYVGNSANFFTTLRAEGAGSLLDLSNVTTLSGATFVNDVLKIEAADGGRVDLSQLEEVTGGLTGFTADGEASIIDLQALTSFTRTGRGGSSLNVLNGGTINAGQLVALDGVGLSLGENGTLPTSQIETITNGAGVIVDGVSPDFSSLTDITGAGFLVRNGGTLALPVTSYVGNSANFFTTLRAEGAGSLLDLSNVTTLSGATFVNDVLKIEAADGGRVDLSQLEEVTGGLTGFTADGEASIIDLQALTSFTRTGRGGSSLNVLNGGTIAAEQLQTLDSVALTSNASLLALLALTTYRGNNLASVLNGGTLALDNLAEVLDGTLTLRADGLNSSITAADLPGLVKEEANGGQLSASKDSLNIESWWSLINRIVNSLL